jgi:hypothetical protein
MRRMGRKERDAGGQRRGGSWRNGNSMDRGEEVRK